MIKDINVGDAVSSQFAVISVSLNSYTKGFKLDLTLGDSTGKVDAVLWDCDPKIGKDFKPGDIVKVKALANLFRDRMQLNLNSIEKAEGVSDLMQFLPASNYNPDKMWEKIDEKISSIDNKHLRTLLDEVFTDKELLDQYKISPGGKKWHHSFLGGLLQHTLYMTQIADYVAGIYPLINRDLLLSGAILHDIGKVVELGISGTVDYTVRGRLEGHISIGYEYIASVIRRIEGFPDDLAAEIKHLILSHQGEQQQGSPIVPMTLEAVALYCIDMLDSQVNAYSQIIETESGDGVEWSKYISLKDRFFYFGEKYNKE
ncbi:MAG: HD domain-containing protein [candidate division Zixibacteria bacterium]|nr:HD domain-containing protein [candidate division Zixibacteria bacterium]